MITRQRPITNSTTTNYLTSLLLAFFLTIPTLTFAQDYTQVVRGRVVDATTQNALVGATVQLVKTDYATTTDTLGRYRFADIPVGRYQLEINYLGYEKIRVLELLVETGKEVIRNVELRPAAADLDEIVVRAERERVTHPVSTRTITVEETRRFPATFFDPARLAASYAGVVNANDQANALIIRGNAPASNNWQIGGAEIVNPNHTPNAGTFSDRPTFTGGGVNILSAQMLDNSTLLTGAFPVQYGNALGGILDMNFRDGNNEKYEFTAQLGLIGIDLAAEGPFSKKGEASFLTNYRYSTIGLLGALGVPLGDEEISFQDLAVNVSLPTKKLGKFTIFGMGGNSKNIFAAPRDSTEISEQKDLTDIRFTSEMGAVGLTHRIVLADQLQWKSTLVYSGTENSRTANFIVRDDFKFATEIDFSTNTKISYSTQLKWQLQPQHDFGIGFNFSNQQFNNESNFTNLTTSNTTFQLFSGQFNIVRPYAFWNAGFFANRLQLSTGLAGVWYENDGYEFTENFASESALVPRQFRLAPRAALQFQLNKKWRINAGYSQQYQFRSPFLRSSIYLIGESNGEDPIFNESQQIVVGADYQLKTDTKASVEYYYQQLAFDRLIGFDRIRIPTVATIYTDSTFVSGTNQGVELSLQKYITTDFYYLLNASFYSATFTGARGEKINSRYNGNYLFNATMGKEWKKEKNKRVAIFGINVRFNYRGGFYETPIDAVRSAEAGYTFYTNNFFNERQPDFYKLDLRLYWKRNKRKYSNTLALDIQNVTNRKNVAFNYYDTQQQQIITKYQLGLIPILNYRIEF